MADRHEVHAHAGAHGEPVGASHVDDTEQFDRDIHLRPIVWTAVGLVIVGIVVSLAMWGLFLGVRKIEQREDRPLSPLPEARQRLLPPEPRLQPDPGLDMREFREVEEQLLTRPAWVDRQRGRVRLPIDLAMDVLARRGLPASAPAGGQVGATGAGQRPPEQVPGQATPGLSAPGRPAPGQQPPPSPPPGGPLP